jgi:hypothetical protein
MTEGQYYVMDDGIFKPRYMAREHFPTCYKNWQTARYYSPKFRAWIMNKWSFTVMSPTSLHGMVLPRGIFWRLKWHVRVLRSNAVLRLDEQSLRTPKYGWACIRLTAGDTSITCGLGCIQWSGCVSLRQMKRHNFVAHKHSTTTSGWLLRSRAWLGIEEHIYFA